MSAVYGPQLPTATDVRAAEAEVDARWGDLIAVCDEATSPAPAEWWRREYEASGALHAAREAAHETRYLSRSRQEDPEAGQ